MDQSGVSGLILATIPLSTSLALEVGNITNQPHRNF